MDLIMATTKAQKNITIDLEVISQINELVVLENRNFSNMVGQLIDEALAARGCDE